ncbi:MAG: response regulator, partial [Myxococcota bacterium]
DTGFVSPAGPPPPPPPAPFLMRIWNAAPWPMGALDGGGRVLFANAALSKRLGQPHDALSGRPLVEFLTDHAGWSKAWAKLQGESSRRVEAELKFGDQLHRLTLERNEPADSGITVLLYLSEPGPGQGPAAQRLETRVRESQRLESLAVLAGGIAHDFNNLLVGVLGNAEAAAASLPRDSPAREPISHVSKAAMRAADLSRQMLAYAGQGSFTIEPIELSKLVQEMVHLLRSLIPNNVKLDLELAEHLPFVEGDVTQLRQVVMNLITNAADACRANGGTITIRTGAQRHESEDLLRTYGAELAPGFYLHLEVDDEGVGMDTETRRRIFDPFFTTKKTGRGLGLAAALGIIRKLEGAIRVQSTPGRGTRFRILLPARARRPRTRSAPLPVLKEGWRGEGTVLLVDDEALVRRAATRMLNSLGFTVAAMSNGAEAIEWATDHPGEAAIVLLDMSMPGLSGVDTFQRLQQLDPSIRVIMSSGRQRKDVLATLHEQGLTAFLAKPYRLTDLRDLLRQVLTGAPPE